MPPGVERQGTLGTMAAGGKMLISVDLKGWVDVLARTSSVGPAVLLAVVAFVQAPGRVTFDTDLDLALNPWHLMGRAVHLWSARSGFGGVGDQTYGFLFPMGPFFAVGHLLDLPDWVVQRLWCALLLVLAYAGMRRLAGRLLGIAPGLAVLAGLAWALSPRLLTVVGPFSAEALPVALLPWLVLPLMTHLPHDPRRAAWLSGLGVLCLGAVNATATLAVLPVPVLFLLTRAGHWRVRLRSVRLWAVAVVLATAWWVGPLLLLGAYSPPFTDWVESAATTTGPVSAFAVLRGATDWVGYVPQGTGGFWPAAWDLATSDRLVLTTALLAALGLAGLVSRRLPERTFLVLTAVLGFAALTIAHAGNPGSPVSERVRSLLDGPLVPFRNIYKFDSILRLPLLLGLVHAVDRTLGWRPQRRKLWVRLPAAGAVCLVLVGASPALGRELRPGPGFAAVPTWWSQAADYVARDGATGRTLVIPQATTGRYRWGRTIGEPLEALARSPWAVRDQVPLTQAGNTRLLDAVEAVLSSGRGSTALAAVLARSGVGQVVVRNDLDQQTADTLPPVRVRQALRRSPGMTLMASFGPSQRPVSRADAVVDGGIDIAPPALEVWRVRGPVSAPHTVPLDEVAAVSGGPEDLLQLVESGLLRGDQASVLTSQAVRGGWAGPRLVTDGLQRRERSFGRVHDDFGPLLTRQEPYRQVRNAHDLLPLPASSSLTTARYDGLQSVTASSSAAFPDNFGGTTATAQPASALDGDPSTYWQSGSLANPVGQWLQVNREAVSTSTTVSIQLVQTGVFGPAVTGLRLTTDAGSVEQPVASDESVQVLTLPRGSWKRLRVTVASVRAQPRFGVVGFRELTFTDLTPTFSAVVPGQLPAGPRAPSYLLHAVEATPPCVSIDGVQRCDPGSAVPSTEAAALDRTITLSSSTSYQLSGTVLPGGGLGIQRLLTPVGQVLTATASSSLQGGTVGADAAVDGRTSTSWVAYPGEALPALTVHWPVAQRVSRLVLVHAAQPAGSAPARVHVSSPGGERDADVGPGGEVRFAPLRSNQLTLTFPAVTPTYDVDNRTGLVARLAVSIAEVRLPEVTARVAPFPPATPTGSVCGFGPTVTVDGHPLPTRVTGTIGDIRASAPLRYVACDGPVGLAAGTHRIRVDASGEFTVRSLELRSPDPTARHSARSVTVTQWGQVHRSLLVAGGAPSLLVVPEAANPGWVATLDGHRLTPQPVDGWQQGWVVPGGSGGEVTLTFAPDRRYQMSLLVGLLAVLVLVWLAFRGRRQFVDEPRATADLAPRRGRGARTAVALALLCAITGGLAGLAGFVVGAGLRQVGWSRAAAVSTWGLALAAVPLVLVSDGTVVGQARSSVQVLCLLAFGLLAATLVPSPSTATAESSTVTVKV